MRPFIVILAAVLLATAQTTPITSSPNSGQDLDTVVVINRDSISPKEGKKEVVISNEQKRSKGVKSVVPVLNFGMQFYNSRLGTSVMALYGEGGVKVNRIHLHTIDTYVALSKWSNYPYEVDKVWGLNYNYQYLITIGRVLRIDIGAKAGYNIYEEHNHFAPELKYKTITFGGPKGQINLNLGSFGIGGGYTMYLGYREYDGVKSATRIDQISILFGVKI